MWDVIKDTIYIASFLRFEYDEDGNKIRVYGKPAEYRMKAKPLSEYLDLKKYGESADRIQKSVVSTAEFRNKVKKGDVAYLEGVTPDGEIVYGENANYFINSAPIFQLTMSLYFERIAGAENVY